MNIPFTHKNCHYNFNTVTGLIRSWAKTVPLMNASEDLRKAAVRAKVEVLRERARQTNQPESQGSNHEQEATQQGNPYQYDAINGVGLVRTEPAAD